MNGSRQKPVSMMLDRLNSDEFGSISIVISAILCRLIMDWLFISYIVPFHSYQYGFQYALKPENYFISWVIIAGTMPYLLRAGKTRASSILIGILYFISFIPTTTIIGLQGISTAFILAFTLFWLSILIMNMYLPSVKLPEINGSTRQLGTLLFTVVVIGISLYVAFRYTNFRVTLDITSVYEIRQKAHAIQMPSIVSHLFYSAKIIIPILFVYYIQKKKYIISLVLVASQVLLFAMDGTKSTLFSMVAVLLIYLTFRKLSLSVTIVGITGFVLLSTLLYFAVDLEFFVDYVVRRIFFVPALLNDHYFTFFSDHPIDLYRQSLFSKIGFVSEYSRSIPYVIGEMKLGNPNAYLNNGLFADAFANLGVVGLVAMPALIVFVFRLIDSSIKSLSSAITPAVVIVAAFLFLSSSFFTILFSHGFVAVILLLIFLPRKSTEVVSK